MTYAVLAPKRLNNEVKVVIDFISDDVEAAKRVAKQTVETLVKKGYESWSKKVKIVSPKTPNAYIELAEQALEVGNALDWQSNGNSFYAQDLINWSNALKVRADELANPESYAD